MLKLLTTAVLITATSLPSLAQAPPDPPAMDAKERGKWFVKATIGPESLLGGLWSTGWGVMSETPEEYPSNLEGFGKRFGMRMTGVSTGNAINVTLGAVWGEDPRYWRVGSGQTFGQRAKHIVGHTFVTKYDDGKTRFAWARLAGNVGNNSLSNLWREQSEVGAGPTAERIAFGVLGQMASNAFSEFWPDVKKKVFKRK